MVRLKERKLEWAFKQKDNGIANKELLIEAVKNQPLKWLA